MLTPSKPAELDPGSRKLVGTAFPLPANGPHLSSFVVCVSIFIHHIDYGGHNLHIKIKRLLILRLLNLKVINFKVNKS